MGSVFDDTVKTCLFYSSEEYPLYVDRDDGYIELGDGAFKVTPFSEDGYPTVYGVKDPSGTYRVVGNLDHYFQSVLPDWTVFE